MLYRFRKYVNYAYFQHRTRGLAATPPLPCDPRGGCEVHTMLSRGDLPLYLVAIKSLLRFHRGLAVVVHSDGSLLREDGDLLRRHLLGVRLVRPEEADARAREVLGTDSFLAKYRAIDASTRRIVDTELFGQAPKRIIIDADTITPREPHELLRWIDHGTGPFLLGQPPTESDAPVSPEVKAGRGFIQDVFKDRLDRVSAACGLPTVFADGATSGFYGATGQLTLENIERVVKAGLEVGVPMQQWCGEQATVVYLLSVAGAQRLDYDRYINFDPGQASKVDGAAVLHFYGTHRFYKGLYVRLAAEVVADLSPTSATRSSQRAG